MLRLIAGEELRAKPRKVGGPGIQLQADEAWFGRKFKHHRGMRGDPETALTIWVVGGIETKLRECEKKRRAFAVMVANRNKPTLNQIFRDNVAPGTEIVTDGWKGYNDLSQLEGCDFTHSVVNHTENFTDPDTGHHTNTQEGTKNDFSSKHKKKNDSPWFFSIFVLRQLEAPQKAIGPQYCNVEDLPEALNWTVWRDYHHGSLWESFLEVIAETPVRFDDAKRPPKKDRIIPEEFVEQLERRRAYRRLRYGDRTEPYRTRARAALEGQAVASPEVRIDDVPVGDGTSARGNVRQNGGDSNSTQISSEPRVTSTGLPTRNSAGQRRNPNQTRDQTPNRRVTRSQSRQLASQTTRNHSTNSQTTHRPRSTPTRRHQDRSGHAGSRRLQRIRNQEEAEAEEFFDAFGTGLVSATVGRI